MKVDFIEEINLFIAFIIIIYGFNEFRFKEILMSKVLMKYTLEEDENLVLVYFYFEEKVMFFLVFSSQFFNFYNYSHLFH